MPSFDTSYPVLIFKASRGPIHHGALGVARSLGRLGVPVYAIVEDRFTPLALSRYVAKVFIWSRWPPDRDAFLNAISAIGNAIARPTVLIPLDDLSAVFAAENSAALGRWFILPHVPCDLPGRLADKAKFYSLCAELGVACPRSKVPRSADDVREFVEQTTFPIVVKGAEQWRPLSAELNVKLIHSRDALFELYDRLDAQRSQIILQEHIPGEHWVYHGYSNADEKLYVSFTGTKLLDYPPGVGSTALGASVRNEPLRRLSEGILRAISYSGISDMDWRRDSRDGQYKIVDCNPRVGMNFRMFETASAVDVVRAQHLDLTGRTIGCAEMVDNRLFIVESICALSYIRGGRSARTTGAGKQDIYRRELAWWSGDDRLPAVAMFVRLVPRTIQRALRYFWARAIALLRRPWRRNEQ